MTGYIKLEEVSALFMAGNNSPQISVRSLHDWLQLHLPTLFMAGYNYTKEVYSLHGWLQLH